MGCGKSWKEVDESQYSDEQVKKSFLAAFKAQKDWAVKVAAMPGSVSHDLGDWGFTAGDGLPGPVVEKIDKVPGGTALVEYVTQRINLVVDNACADPRVAEIMENAYKKISESKGNAYQDMRDCFHGKKYLNNDGSDGWDNIQAWFFDENEDLTPGVFKDVAKDAVAGVDGANATYENIRAAWEKVPSIPMVFQKPEVTFDDVETTVAKGIYDALQHYCMQYEYRQRGTYKFATKIPMTDDEKKVFIDEDPVAKRPYGAIKGYDYSDDSLPPLEPEFKQRDKSFDLAAGRNKE